MFRRDPKAGFQFKMRGFLIRRKVYFFVSGKLSTKVEIEDDKFKQLIDTQLSAPLLVMHDSSTKRTWWMFRGDSYCEDEGFTSAQVETLVLDKIQQARRKIQRAENRLSAIPDRIGGARERIPDEIKLFVWQRDKGQCVSCGSAQKLEYDHIIPLAKGGSNTARNLQLLCEPCNREKSSNIC